MPFIAKRKERRRQSALLRQARLNLLLEIERLENKRCDTCKNTKGNGSIALIKCGCPVAIRTREIGEELLTLTNERSEIEGSQKEVEKVAEKKTIEITEAAVNKMKADGMTYAAIAKEFGISAPRLATLRQNWELERVRAQHKEGQGQTLDKPRKTKGASTVEKAEKDMLSKHSLPTSGMVDHENEIRVLKEALIRKMDIIQEQKITINQLKAERDELAKDSGTTGDWQKEIKDERKLLAILLERETAKIKNLVLSNI